ncbi:MAG: 4-hydroxy-tetrahydrodipicolinate synthase [Proteobacteria bacterium]|nr:4-hydroxy-tetrahydrodipicolinate synthase [Pseudomonadota bacterium]
MKSEKFKGLGTALITPFRNGGEIDYDMLTKLIEFQIRSGVDYLVMVGTTGEGVTLDDEETTEIVKFTMDKVNKRIPVVIGCGSNNTNSLLRKIRTLNMLNPDGYLVVSPYYNKPTQDGLIAHYGEVAKAAENIPVILYNIPGRTGGWIMPETVCKLATKHNNIIAIKEASGNVNFSMDMCNTVSSKVSDFVFLSGDDALTLPLMAVGYSGVISVVSNETPKQMKEMITHALKQDFISASKIHYMLWDLMNANFIETSPGPVKYAMKKLGYCDGSVRLPLSELKDTAKMDEILKGYL